MYKIWFLFLGYFSSSIVAKICWKECEDFGVVSKADIEGCHRRQGKNGRRPLFHCRGTEGPPCTVIRGETVHLNIDFHPDRVIKNLTQAAYWESSWGMDIPWAGLETDGCKFTKNNKDCSSNDVLEVQQFSYPIFINEMYPSGTYDLRWEFSTLDAKGRPDRFGCFRFVIRIV